MAVPGQEVERGFYLVLLLECSPGLEEIPWVLCKTEFREHDPDPLEESSLTKTVVGCIED